MSPCIDIISERGEELNEIVKIGNHNLSAKTYNGQRVVTFKDIDTVHERPDGTARKRFSDNKDRFIEGEDYFKVKCCEVRPFFGQTLPNGFNPNADIMLLTESGYLMLVKSFTDDLAWAVQRKLVDSYFRVKKTVNEELSPQTQLLLQLAQSIAEKELQDKERDRQIAIAKETAEKAVETTEKIKGEFIQTFDNWRDDINKKVRQISQNSGISYQELFSEMYRELERSGYDLVQRQRNKRNRMEAQGCTKTSIDRETTKISIIEDDKKAKKIFGDIVARYAVKYIA